MDEKFNFSSEMIPGLNSLCRTCLVPEKDLISIYHEEYKNDSLMCVADILGNLTNMPSRTDGLPEMVCISCADEIQKIHIFKMKCINSECILRKILEEHDEKKLFQNDTTTTIEELAGQSLSFKEEIKDQSLSDTSEFVIIKSEEPSCSFYVGNTDTKEVDHKNIETQQVMKVMIKEEPSLSAWSVQNYEPEMETELRDENVDTNEENQTISHMSEQNRQATVPESDSEADLSKTYTNANEVSTLEVVDRSNNGCNSKLRCPNCQKLFMHLSRLKRHIRTKKCEGHNTSRNKLIYTCSLCGKNYNHQFSLRRHSLLYHKQKLTKEIIAESTEHKTLETDKLKKVETKTDKEITKPINIEASSIEAMRQCPNCKDVFENDETLAQHKKLHKKEKSHICNLCNKAFSFRHNLKLHLMNHKQIKPFKCEQCNQRFVRNSCLTRHLKTHSRDRPFICEFCNKGFPYMYALKIHQSSHLDDRPYSCTICSMRFKYAYNLKEHHRTHTGEKPYACKICPRRLSSKTNFRIHMRIHEKTHGILVEQLIADSEKTPVNLNIE